MFCSHCGTAINSGDVFCRNCGNPLPHETRASIQTSARKAGSSFRGTIWIVLGVLLVGGGAWLFTPNAHKSAESTTAESTATSSYQVFICPPAGCEVGTDVASSVALVMYQGDTPSDTSGAFTSAQKAEMYREYVDSGKIITVQNHTHGDRKYETPARSETSARVSVVKLLDGDYAGRVVLVPDKYLLR